MAKKRQKNTKYFPIFIFISILFMSIGYALINSVILNVAGNLIAKNQSGVFITEITHLSNKNVDISKIKFTNIYQTMLSSEIILSNSDPTSYITYQITVYNSSNNSYYFDGAIYEKESEMYSNSNIIFKLDNIQTGDKIEPQTTKTLNITFSYKNQTLPSSNSLISYITFNFIEEPTLIAEYSYIGNYQTFIAPQTGKYKIELWGADGVSAAGENAQGGYVKGDLDLSSNTQLHVYVGGKGQRISQAVQGTSDGGGYNGGGNASNDEYSANNRFGGGGATDVRLISGAWNNFDSLKSRIIVAGGGGSYSEFDGGNAGGLIGYEYPHERSGGGGTQTSGGDAKISTLFPSYPAQPGGFGYGGKGGSYASGGGGGYYGGGGGVRDTKDGGGGGGSSFISGHSGCDAIAETTTSTNIIHTGQSIHYSGYKFTNTQMIDGAGYEWTTDKRTTIIGVPNYPNIGVNSDGYAKISLLHKSDITEKGIYIDELEYSANNAADTTNSKVIKYNNDEIYSNINLSSTDPNSSITYKITIYNNDDISYYYDGLIYDNGIDTYSNENIIVTTENISIDEEIPANSSKTIYLTYSYKNNTLASNNNLKSFIKLNFTEIICPKDERVCDLSGNNHHLNLVGATWDKYNGVITTDGIDDYLYTNILNFQGTDQFTLEFIVLFPEQSTTGTKMLFETSLDSNANYGSFYVDSFEYGTNDITLAMKYHEKINHRMSDNILDNNNYRQYTITMNTQNGFDKFTKMYVDATEKSTALTRVTNSDISGLTLYNYPLYIATRAGTGIFAKMQLKELRIYKKALTSNEILSNYNGSIIRDNLIAHYKFNS